jgi:hypothetical protein
MRRIALLTALAIAAPIAAHAQPVRVYERDRDHDRDYDRDRRDRDSLRHDRYDRWDRSHWYNKGDRWEPIARNYSAQTDRQFIPLNGQRFRKIRIEGIRGQPVILKIAIEFMDRTTQAVDLNQRLPRGVGEVIDLNGGDRRVNRIIVYPDPRFRGAYSIYGY